MSGNSNLGYANLDPYINGQFTNSNSSQYAGNFGSNETQKGGNKGKWKDSIKRKIKNITRKYKKMAKKRSKSMKKRMRSRYLRKSKSRNMKGGYTYKKRKSSRKTTGQKGGQYTQFGSNITQPSGYSPNFNIGGNSALANPMSHTAGGVEANEYNHYKYSAV